MLLFIATAAQEAEPEDAAAGLRRVKTCAVQVYSSGPSHPSQEEKLTLACVKHSESAYSNLQETTTQVPSANMDGEGFMDGSAASLKQEGSVVSGALQQSGITAVQESQSQTPPPPPSPVWTRPL